MINTKISNISDIVLSQLHNSYPYSCGEDLPVILLSYASKDCYNKQELKKYNDLLNSYLFDCLAPIAEIKINNSNRENWEKNNPGCVSRKQWEKIALKLCNEYRVEFVVEKIEKNCEAEITIEQMDNICDIAFDITKKSIDCDVITAISVQQKMCDLEVKVEKNKDECITEYKLLVEKYPNCNLTKKEYIYLLDTNYSFEVISTIYDKKLTLEVDPYGNTTLVSPLKKYTLPDDLKFKDIVVDSVTKDLVLPKKLISEYKINNNKKQKILNEIYFI